MPEYACRCAWCKAGAYENKRRRRETTYALPARNWQRDYEDATR